MYGPGGLTPRTFHPALGNAIYLQITDWTMGDSGMDISIWPIAIWAVAFKF
jgi:hypothetical protein